MHCAVVVRTLSSLRTGGLRFGMRDLYILTPLAVGGQAGLLYSKVSPWPGAGVVQGLADYLVLVCRWWRDVFDFLLIFPSEQRGTFRLLRHGGFFCLLVY